MPIPSQFRTQTELIRYLENLEQRIEVLEAENQALREAQKGYTETELPDLPALPYQINALLDERLPKSKMFSLNFLTRAFTVWGHYFTAQLIILAGLLVIGLSIRIVILAAGR
jgi:hypothetical protein